MVKVYDGYDYEKWCAEHLKKQGFKNIKVTQASNDQGIDILASYKGLSYGIQCKFYSSSVGNQSVQQAYSGAAYYGCDKAMVITNQSFTRSAKQLADELDVILYPQCDPTHQSWIQKFFRKLRFFELLMGICLFIAILLSKVNDHRLFLSIYSISISISSCFGLIQHKKITYLILSFLFELNALFCLVTIVNFHSIWFSCILFHSVILLGIFIQSSIQQHSKNIQNKIIQQEMNQSLHQDEVFTIAKNLQELIESECHCHCEIKKYNEDNILSIQYHCDCNIADDLATAQYSINQYYSYKQVPIQVQLFDLGRRMIEARVEHEQ